MFNKAIKTKNFLSKKKTLDKKKRFLNLFQNLIESNNQILSSMDKNYKDAFSKKFVSSFKNMKNFNLIGIGGSALGAKAIFNFLKPKKKFKFVDNFSFVKNKKKNVNLIISKSGNTLETISNSNILINKKDKNIFVTENKKNYLTNLANKLKAEVIHHNNYIGGRYSVLSEVGMLPAELMGLKSKNFRHLNTLIKNKSFYNALISNVSSTLHFIKQKKFNSIIINYDQKSENLFNWYQQLIAESLGKKKKGLLPIISNMPKDNHSVMQLYLDGFKNNFYTFFSVNESTSLKINNNLLLKSQNFLKNKDLSEIISIQRKATENVFKKKNIPFRSFLIKKRNEETLGTLFSFFILETILLGKSLNLNPYDQPAVELIKKETKSLLI